MKLPNSYGSVIKLGGKRRKPYAVRISKLVEDDTGKVKRKYTYLAYFSKPEMAYTYLAEYNSGAVVPEHMKYSDSPTFAEIYEKWKKYRKSLKNQISDSTWRNYEIAFNHFSDLHSRKFISIRTNDFTAMPKRLQSQSADYDFFHASRTKGDVPIFQTERIHRPGFNGRSGL